VARRPVAEASPADLEPFRALRDPARVRESPLFVAEGRRIVGLLLAASRFEVVSALVSRTSLEALDREGVAWPDDVPVWVATEAEMRGIGGHSFHQGCLALARRPASRTPAETLARLPRGPRRVVCLEAVTNPDNVGGILRSAHALGADAVLLDGRCASPLYRKALRASLGAALTLPTSHGESAERILADLGDAGVASVALTTDRRATPIADLVGDPVVRGPLALWAGNEGDGLSPGVLAAAHRRVFLPMTEGADSLNVNVAVALALQALAPARREAGAG
jgi:tRNA G18 (ribose-2'-O)-methylase SpoU